MIVRIVACLLFASLLLNSPSAYADARTMAYFQGMAFGIAANCPNLRLNEKEIALSRKNGMEGYRKGDAKDFEAGAFTFSDLLNDKNDNDDCYPGKCSCENICTVRGGTCYFLLKPDGSPAE